MMRIAGICGLAIATTAAAPPQADFSRYAVLEQPTVPGGPPAAFPAPVPGSLPGAAFAPAPVPDVDAIVPQHRSSGPAQAEVQANVFTAQKSYHGEGYLFGSSVQGSQQRKFRPAPGFSLKVPLE